MLKRSVQRFVAFLVLVLGVWASSNSAPLDAQEVDALGESLTSAIGAYRWGDATWGVMVRSLDTGETLFELNVSRTRAPRPTHGSHLGISCILHQEATRKSRVLTRAF